PAERASFHQLVTLRTPNTSQRYKGASVAGANETQNLCNAIKLAVSYPAVLKTKSQYLTTDTLVCASFFWPVCGIHMQGADSASGCLRHAEAMLRAFRFRFFAASILRQKLGETPHRIGHAR